MEKLSFASDPRKEGRGPHKEKKKLNIGEKGKTTSMPFCAGQKGKEADVSPRVEREKKRKQRTRGGGRENTAPWEGREEKRDRKRGV